MSDCLVKFSAILVQYVHQQISFVLWLYEGRRVSKYWESTSKSKNAEVTPEGAFQFFFCGGEGESIRNRWLSLLGKILASLFLLFQLLDDNSGGENSQSPTPITLSCLLWHAGDMWVVFSITTKIKRCQTYVRKQYTHLGPENL